MSKPDLSELLRRLASGASLPTAAEASGHGSANRAADALQSLAERLEPKPKATRRKAADDALDLPDPPTSSPFPEGMPGVAYADGASRGNPGPASYGCVYHAGDLPVCGEAATIGRTTNNVAEYKGAIAVLQRMVDWKVPEVVLRLDSQLVVKQLAGEYRVKDAKLKPLFDTARALADKLPSVRFEHVPRAENALADRLANAALDGER